MENDKWKMENVLSDPYGKALLEWSATNDTGLNSRKFTGYERDATGLDYANARTYASERGRFIQPDPIGIGGARLEQPQSMNRYAYVQNDPINFVDKSGLLLESPDGISGSGSDCQSIFVAVDWSSSDGPTGTGVLSYGFTYRSCVTSSGGSSGGADSLVPAVTTDDLIRALERLPRGCIDFFGGQGTINQRIQELRNGTMMITFIDMRSQGGQLIPDDVYRRTYQQYWNQDAARGGNPNALAKSLAIRGPGIDKTILLGSGYFDPGWEFSIGNFISGTFPRGAEQLQELVLIHEYMHILNNMNEMQLWDKWTTGPGAAAISDADRDTYGRAMASAIWMTNGCPRQNQ